VITAKVGEEPIACVEAQVCLSLRLVRTVTEKELIGRTSRLKLTSLCAEATGAALRHNTLTRSVPARMDVMLMRVNKMLFLDSFVQSRRRKTAPMLSHFTRDQLCHPHAL
jgi:hypothetical protein